MGGYRVGCQLCYQGTQVIAAVSGVLYNKLSLSKQLEYPVDGGLAEITLPGNIG